ncbi:MAG: S-layer homology domain-containing protein [Chloroflexia bacterium]
MKRNWIVGLAAALVLVLSAWVLYGASAVAQKPPPPAPQAVPTVCGQMNVVPSPNVGSGDNTLYAMSAGSSDDIWAVGYDGNVNQQTLVEHWNGTDWSVVPSQNPSGRGNFLYGVSAVSADDVWAVGSYFPDYVNSLRMLAEHWNGTGWSIVPTPNVGTGEFYAVSALSGSDVWAVGYYNNSNSIPQALVEHWDGTAWSIVPSPNPGSADNLLWGVSALSGGDIWAVGYYLNLSNAPQTLAEHWDGTAWSIVPSPNPGSADNHFYGVSALASGDVWAVGDYSNDNYMHQTLTEHWDGTAWSVISSPNPGSYDNHLNAVSALASGDVWAVGSSYTNNYGPRQTLTEHWNGTAWSVVPGPSPSNSYNYLVAISALANGDVWAVGFYANGSYLTLVEKYGGPCGGPTATPTATNMALATATSTVTNTAMPASNTPASTVTNTAMPPSSTPMSTATNTPGPPSITPTSTPVPTQTPVGPTATPTPLPTCPSSWRVVNSPNNPTCGALFGVAARTADDIWAVGSGGCDIATGGSLIEHWDGRIWQVVPSPQTDEILVGVVAVASNDAWAVGVGDSSEPPLIEHWDGTRWTQVASPVSAGGLEGIAAVSPTDIWAVGGDNRQGDDRPLVLHWDGVHWSTVPTYSGLGSLTGVVALTAQNIWAVGGTGFGVGAVIGTLVEHWDGASWHQVPSPNPDPAFSTLVQVAAVLPNDLWAVGTANRTSPQTLILHWDGGAWRPVASPSLPPASRLWSIAAGGPDDLWAVGDAIDYAAGQGGALVLHWDGAAWSLVPSPGLGPSYTSLWGVVALAGHDVWAVGNHGDRSANRVQTLVERYVDNGTFSDVHSTDYFYTPVTYLASHGIISGYSDCTFRPYNNTTRSQMVKIVVLGFNKAITTPGGGAHSFTDVPPSNPFFPMVETAYADGIVSGYNCGTAPAGPCDAQRRPYFLPYANVTRGQLSKIDVIAAGWTLSNPPAPTFTDVPRGSTFYTVIETAVCHGVISGYSDHTFRPFNNAIRGQIAKIVYLSITNPPVSCGP